MNHVDGRPAVAPDERPGSTRDTTDILGLVDVVVIEFPAEVVGGAGFDRQLSLVDRGVVRILDLEFVSRPGDGRVVPVEVPDVPVADGVDPTPVAGTTSDLVDAADLDVLHSTLGTGSIAVVLLDEEQALNPVIAAWPAAAGRPVPAGHLDPADLADALDATNAGPVSDPEFESLKVAIMA